ncbi:MAG: extracellular solute-binding protein [Lachnospiraceae bacterium]|nr:extracellular solute-binding protein [Lachnospiraceae bacterium]
MKKYKRILSGALCTAMFLTAVSGCGAAKEKEAVSESTEKKQTETDTVTAAVPEWESKIDWEKIGWKADPDNLEWKGNTTPTSLEYYVNFSWFSLDWDDKTSERVTEKTGVDLNLSKPVTDDGQKLSMMIAGNQLPDLMTVDKNDAALQQMIEADMLWSIDDLIAEYAPQMKDILPKELLQNYRAEDGKTYQLTTWVQGEAWQKAAEEYNQLVGTNQPMIAIRSDYYDEIGRPEIKNIDDFMDALKQIQEKHPDKIGFYPADGGMSASNFASSASLSYYGIEMGLSSDYNITEDGSVEWVVRDDAFKTPMEYLNKMYLEGLLTKDPFVDTKDVAKSKIEQGDMISYSWTISDGTKVPADNPDTSYEILPPFETYKQVRTGTGWLATVVPKTCKEPERAIQLLEYMASAEGHADISWGIEGEEYTSVEDGANWHAVDGKPVLLEGYVKDKNADWGGVASRDGLGEYWLACNELLWNLAWWDDTNEEMKKYNDWFGDYVVYQPELDIQAPSPESEEGIIKQKAYNLLQEYSVKMVFTEDFEAAYDEFLSKVDSLGMDQVEAYWTEEYKGNMKNMEG